jgi:hypothetical protein
MGKTALAITNGIPQLGFGTFGRIGDADFEAMLFTLETG